MIQTFENIYGKWYEQNKKIVSLDGLVTGNWTLRVQAKMLPYVPYQAFSLVITVDGVVIPPVHGSSPVPIDPKILQKCQVDGNNDNDDNNDSDDDDDNNNSNNDNDNSDDNNSNNDNDDDNNNDDNDDDDDNNNDNDYNNEDEDDDDRIFKMYLYDDF